MWERCCCFDKPPHKKLRGIDCKKTPVGESDTIVTFFTKQFGKIRATAKNSASSRKRFGGHLQPFIRLNIELSETRFGNKIVQDAETVNSFEDVAKDMGIFLKAHCLLELLDAALEEEETPCEEIFAEAVKALSSMSKGDRFGAMLVFQTALLESCGYGTDISRCGECDRKNFGRGSLIFPTGRALCAGCANGSEEKPAGKINCAVGVTDGGALENINCLNAFFQYQTGKVLKSAKVLENMRK